MLNKTTALTLTIITGIFPVTVHATAANGALALALSKELYCSVVTTISGDMGVMVGLIIAAFGFYQMIRKGISASVLITIFFGVIITAMPAIFEKSMDTLGEVMAPLGGRGTVLDGKGMANRTTCDFGSDNIKAAMSGTSINASNWGITENDDYASAIRKRESSGDYSSVNSLGYMGAYQMGDSALQEAGFKDSNGNWTSFAASHGVTSNESFLASPSAQDTAASAYTQSQWSQIKNLGLDSYVGQTYAGTTITESGLLGTAHLIGAGGLQSMLTGDGKYNTSDANNTNGASYLALFNNREVSI